MANTILSLPPEGTPQFDELYVVSDLHLGGPSDFQIFNSGTELAALIDLLRAAPSEKRLALLINGDFVDFLAEQDAKHFDPAGAITKLNRIVEDGSFKLVFSALKKFTNTKNRTLVMTLGNHDLELALPWVRARLLDILTDGKEAAYGRIILAFDGAGFPCRVGNATVLCVHGNEVDPWNVADYERIRRFGVEVSHGRPIDSWVPNAGSQLVIDVMNGLKRKYPFVDLLKPETQAAVPTLLALAPNQHDKLLAIGATVRRLAWDKIKRATGFLGAQEDDLPGRTAATADAFAPRSSPTAAGAEVYDREEYANLLLDGASEQYHRGVDPMSLLSSDELGGYLGLTSAVYKLFKGEEISYLREHQELLRRARDHYWDSFMLDRTNSWAVVQYLSLTLMMQKSGQFKKSASLPEETEAAQRAAGVEREERDPDGLWSLAHLLSLYDLNSKNNQARIWAHGNLIELYLLSLAMRPSPERPNAAEAKKRALRHADTLVDLAGRDSFEVYSTRRQILRYIEWFGVLSRMGAAPMALAEAVFQRFPEEAEDKWK